MKKIFFLSLVLFLTLTFKAFCQTSPVPEGYTLAAKEDYAKYEPDLIKTIDWLQQTPWGEQPERKKANAFLVAWLTGSPSVSLTVSPALMEYCKKNTELLISFMGGYTKEALQHKSDFNATQGDIAGIKAMIDKYNSDPNRVRDKKMEGLTQTEKDGKLDEWVKTVLEKK